MNALMRIPYSALPFVRRCNHQVLSFVVVQYVLNTLNSSIPRAPVCLRHCKVYTLKYSTNCTQLFYVFSFQK